jgi:hypothetical protein
MADSAKDGKPKPPGRPVGRTARWSAADLYRLARVGPEDVAAAKAEFRRLAPRSVRKLLDRKD